MRTFVVPDIHGRYESLRALLTRAGVLDSEGKRHPALEFVAKGSWEPYQVVSIGDLANATLVDQNGDERCLLAVREWFDTLILGNHESGYLFNNMGFNGYYPAPHLRSLYNALRAEGKVVPAVLVGKTLLTHAGVHKYFEFDTPLDAYDAIWDVWNNYEQYRDDWGEKFYFGPNIEIPKALLLDAVSGKRGGGTPFGGIVWSDWEEPKNDKFSQVVGHTPKKNGPIITEYKSTGVFHLNIDCAAKKGLPPSGVWLDEDGRVDHYVTVTADDIAA